MFSESFNVKELLGLHPSSSQLQSHISSLVVQTPASDVTIPEVKSYPDAVYFNYYSLGLSLLFKPINGYKTKTGLKVEDLKNDDLVVDGVDIYNLPKPNTGSASGTSKLKSTYSTFPLSVILSLSQSSSEGSELRPSHIEVKLTTTGKEFVECMGEPERKGGGAGPSSGSIGIWCEWSKDGVMVEFGGDESRGPQAWERGKDAVWKVITVFQPNDE
ncbi:hypothetical protein BKA93DRAFT_793842, partial [Sparassis latifolia]|uniref:Uncharacterized protein n=1 Tax=Sparassis crispa TaxID=139825 RepID=A0A401G7Y5_9APHY|nr:hypothetical protein SCP_0111410 [Sparassis crispa]GBE78258.1 hypothetical protein SCP_0111410 [Sparassis crispa]